MADEPQIIAVPEFYANGVQIAADGTDFQILFMSRAVAIPPPEPPILIGVAAINMSRGSIADLHASLGGILAKLDKDFGPVSTPYLEEQKAAE